MNPVVIVRAVPFTPDEAATLHTQLHLAGFQGWGSFVPYVEQVVREVDLGDGEQQEWRMMNQIIIDLAEGRLSLNRLVNGVPIDIAPATDDRPFFFKLEPGVPEVLAGLGWISAIALAAVTGVPLLRIRERPPILGSLLLFLAIGVGFMLTEVALFQKLVLYLGHPTTALSLLLFSLLLGTGLGSLCSQRVPVPRIRRALVISLLVDGAAVVAVPALLESWLAAHAGAGAPGRLVAMAGLGGLGFVLGFPFPLAVRWMEAQGLAHHVPWMWAVNGVASVFGSVLAVAIAVAAGLSWALLLGGVVYLGAAAAGAIDGSFT